MKQYKEKKCPLSKKIVLVSEYYYTCVNVLHLFFSRKFITWKRLLTGFKFSVKILLTKINFWFQILLCYLLKMSPFCIGSISWCYFVFLLFRWCSPVSAIPLFLTDWKLADVTPVYKRRRKTLKITIRPVAILCNISKI